MYHSLLPWYLNAKQDKPAHIMTWLQSRWTCRLECEQHDRHKNTTNDSYNSKLDQDRQLPLINQSFVLFQIRSPWCISVLRDTSLPTGNRDSIKLPPRRRRFWWVASSFDVSCEERKFQNFIGELKIPSTSTGYRCMVTARQIRWRIVDWMSWFFRRRKLKPRQL